VIEEVPAIAAGHDPRDDGWVGAVPQESGSSANVPAASRPRQENADLSGSRMFPLARHRIAFAGVLRASGFPEAPNPL
jgi:hypothetical protein